LPGFKQTPKHCKRMFTFAMFWNFSEIGTC